MKVKDLKKILKTIDDDKDVMIRYETEVAYSELTSGAEDVIGWLVPEAVIENETTVVFAADLCSCTQKGDFMWLELAAKIYVITQIVGIIFAACVIVGVTIWFCCKKDE